MVIRLVCFSDYVVDVVHTVTQCGGSIGYSGSSPVKSAASTSYSNSCLDKGISWNIGPFEAGAMNSLFPSQSLWLINHTLVPVFDTVGKMFLLDKDTLNDLAAAGLSCYSGKIPGGTMVLVGHTCSWWKLVKSVDPKLSFNPNWVVVIGVPNNLW